MKQKVKNSVKSNATLKNLTLTSMFIAVGFILPFFTGQIPLIGNMLLPMHLPVFLCALICGWKYGLSAGLILPLMRSLILGMPPLYPIALAMTFELAAYGFVSGFLYEKARWKCIISLYRSLIAAMVAGRLVWGLAEVILLGIKGNSFTLGAFVTGALTNAIPGIIIQLSLIPLIMVALSKTKLVPFSNAAKKPADKKAV